MRTLRLTLLGSTLLGTLIGLSLGGSGLASAGPLGRLLILPEETPEAELRAAVESGDWERVDLIAEESAVLGQWIPALVRVSAEVRFAPERRALEARYWEWTLRRAPWVAGYWTGRGAFSGVPVRKRHELIDPERIPYGTRPPQARSLGEGRGGFIEAPDPDVPGPLMRSAQRMRQGFPAIDGRGAEIEVCQLMLGERAGLFEMSPMVAHRLVIENSGFRALEAACLRGEARARYWRWRSRDYVDPRDHPREPVPAPAWPEPRQDL